MQLGAVAVAVAALLLVRRIPGGDPDTRAPREPVVPPGTAEHPTSPKAPPELLSAWVQYLRSEVADASNSLNNRLGAIKAHAKAVDGTRLSREQRDDLAQIDYEVERAAAITVGLLKRVSSVAPDSVPAAVTKLADGPSRPADILVVEDDDANRRVMCRLLEKLGHRVTPARNGIEAWEEMETGEFDCIICDVQMPSLSGRGLFEQVEEHRPTLASRFVFVTGDFTRPETRTFIERAGCPIVAKPYDLETLLAAIATSLERGGLIEKMDARS